MPPCLPLLEKSPWRGETSLPCLSFPYGRLIDSGNPGGEEEGGRREKEAVEEAGWAGSPETD